MKDENDVDKSHFFFINGYISQIKNDDKLFYLACPSDNCKKKVVEEDKDRFRCDSCDRVYTTCVPTYMIIAKVTDFTDSIYVNFARDHGNSIMSGLSAEQFKDFKQGLMGSEEGSQRLKNYFDSLLLK